MKRIIATLVECVNQEFHRNQFLGTTFYFIVERLLHFAFPCSILKALKLRAVFDDTPNMDTDSFVSFLRMEADLSEEKAKRLRAQADALAQQHGITGEMESAYGEFNGWCEQRYPAQILEFCEEAHANGKHASTQLLD